MQSWRSKISKWLFFHPLLLALFIIVSTIRSKLLFFPPKLFDIAAFSLTTLAITFFLFKLGLFFFHYEKKAGIFSSAILVFVFFYYIFFNGLFGVKIIYDFIYNFIFQKFHIVLLSFGFIFLGVVFFYLKRTKGKLSTLTRYLNLFFLLILIFEISKVFFNHEFKVNVNRKFNEQEIRLQKNQEWDIYYLVMDSYTSSGSLRKYWNYENKVFQDYLISKGFFIAEKSRCNYNSTPFSILSALNMSYLNIENYDEGQRVHISKVFGMIQHGDVVRTLSENGYEIVNLSLFDLMGTPAYYSDPFYHKSSLFDKTIFHLIADKLGFSADKKLFKNLSNVNQEIIDRIPLSNKNGKPVFCYAHPMMPHEPFFFDDNGNQMPDAYALNSDEKDKKYLLQLKYTNKLLVQTVENILTNSKTKPIIIIQGDHGFRYLDRINYDEQLEESKTIFNAYLFPEDSLINSVYDSISPVNSFRIIFNNYFGTKLPLLEDKSYNIEIKED